MGVCVCVCRGRGEGVFMLMCKSGRTGFDPEMHNCEITQVYFAGPQFHVMTCPGQSFSIVCRLCRRQLGSVLH